MPKQKDDAILLEGKTVEALKGGHFRIELDNGHEVLGHLSGKMRKHHIRILPGDRVQVEVSAYDLTRGRITYRERNAGAPGGRPGGNRPGGPRRR